MKTMKTLAVAGLCAVAAACAAPPKEPPKIALPPAPPPGEPAGLPGLDAQAVRVAFGTPAFVRKDGRVEIWRYDNPACKAFFFLYANEGMLTVRHVETLPRGHEMAADEGCLALLKARPSQAPAS